MRWFQVTWTLLLRTILVKARDPICLATQLSTSLLMGPIFGALYYDSYNKSNDSFAILDTQMCIVMVTMMTMWLPYDVTLTWKFRDHKVSTVSKAQTVSWNSRTEKRNVSGK